MRFNLPCIINSCNAYNNLKKLKHSKIFKAHKLVRAWSNWQFSNCNNFQTSITLITCAKILIHFENVFPFDFRESISSMEYQEILLRTFFNLSNLTEKKLPKPKHSVFFESRNNKIFDPETLFHCQNFKEKMECLCSRFYVSRHFLLANFEWISL